ncbi:MAG: hypothetical protein EAX86_09225 [Candidatus Heimdallarchaeota archaeon]|nr:hypothetical protein [Candidatus Heimdallarchaeota archaeon]
MSNDDQQSSRKTLLEKISVRYGVSSNDFHFLAEADNNFIYEFILEGKEYILRAGTRHKEELIQAEIEWILFLHSQNIKVSIPVHSKVKKYLEQVEHEGKIYQVVAFEKALGDRVELRNPAEWNEQFWETMGKVMANLHQASVLYNSHEPQYRRPMYYEDEYVVGLDDYLDSEEDKAIFQIANRLLKHFEELPTNPDAFGVIHTDLHTDNFHKHGNNMIIFDWDDSYYFFFIYDLAAAFHETIWDNPVEKRQEFADRFIPVFWKGYSSVYPLDRKWLNYLSEFFKWREFIIYVCVVKDLKKGPPNKQTKLFLNNVKTEFRDLLVNNKQMVDIPSDLAKWFPH